MCRDDGEKQTSHQENGSDVECPLEGVCLPVLVISDQGERFDLPQELPNVCNNLLASADPSDLAEALTHSQAMDQRIGGTEPGMAGCWNVAVSTT